MPGRLFLARPQAEIERALGVPSDHRIVPRRNIAPGVPVPVLAAGAGAIAEMRWGIVPVGRVNARGRPVMETIVNIRSETMFAKSAFEGMSRAIVPADGWYEWTGKPRRKTAWRIARRDGGLLYFAALCDTWLIPGGKRLWQVATVTCAPNKDVEAVHDRMGALIDRNDVETWLCGTPDDARALAVPLADGVLSVERADDTDWTRP